MSYTTAHAHSLDQALELLASGNSNMISRIPFSELMAHAARVRHGLLDFDGTLTPSSQWSAIRSLLDEEQRTRDQENLTWYYKHIHDQEPVSPSLDDPDWWIADLHSGNKPAVDAAWSSSTIYMMKQARVTRRQLDQVASALPVREGVKSLFQLLHHRAIVSFGMEQFIQTWAQSQGITTAVAASRLLFTQEGLVDGVHLNMVGSRSKEFVKERFLRAAHAQPEQVLVVGDSVVDLHMMDGESFNVLVVPPSELERKMRDFRENNLAAMWNRVTMILASDSLEPLVTFLLEARETP